MDDHDKTKDQLIEELNSLRQSAAELKASLLLAEAATRGDDEVRRSFCEETLLENEIRYRSLFENMGNAVAVYRAERDGEDFVFIDFNRAASAIEQVERNEVIGRSVLEVFPGVRQFGLFDVFQRVWRTGNAEHFPVARYEDKRICGWRDNFVYRLPSGEIVAVYSDETERKKAELALQESEERWQFALEGAGDGVWDWNAQTNEVFFSRQWKAMLGYGEDEIGSSLDEWDKRVHPDDHAQCYEDLNRHFRDETSQYSNEHRLLCKDGRYKWILDRGRVMQRTADGNPLRVIGTHTDITDRKNLEAQLLQSQKMQALGTLAAGIAHDFNNMLQVILGYTDILLSDKRPGEPGYAELQRIIGTSRDAANLVQKIRILSGRADIQRNPLDLNKTSRDMVDLLKQTLPRTVNVSTQLSGNLDTVNADPGLMNQMVMNLATNAEEAMPDGGTVTIETKNIVLDNEFCRVHEGMKPGPHVMLTVSDTGRGMGKEMIERLFDPFFSTKERDYHKGTGLGLSVVHGIVALHGGCITVESEVGKGTTFRIYLPVLAPKEAPVPMEGTPAIPLGQETILVVEDEQTVRDLERLMLESQGYKVLAVADGQEALEVYKREQANISLVILDIIMPRMEGKKCMEELLRTNLSVKVLITTGVARDELIDEVMALGAKDSLIKPYSAAELLRKVRAALDSD
jgi:PAS domain S-box-containing protein